MPSKKTNKRTSSKEENLKPKAKIIKEKEKKSDKKISKTIKKALKTTETLVFFSDAVRRLKSDVSSRCFTMDQTILDIAHKIMEMLEEADEKIIMNGFEKICAGVKEVSGDEVSSLEGLKRLAQKYDETK